MGKRKTKTKADKVTVTAQMVPVDEMKAVAGEWLVAKPDEVKVKTEDDYITHVSALREIKAARNELKAQKERYYRPLKIVLDRISEDVAVVDKPLAELEDAIRKEAGGFVDKVYARELKKTTKRSREARKAGNLTLARKIEGMLEVKTCAPEVFGVGLRQMPSVEVIDQEQLMAEHPEFFTPDLKKIGAMVKSLGPVEGEQFFGGAVEVKKTTQLVVRKKNGS